MLTRAYLQMTDFSRPGQPMPTRLLRVEVVLPEDGDRVEFDFNWTKPKLVGEDDQYRRYQMQAAIRAALSILTGATDDWPRSSQKSAILTQVYGSAQSTRLGLTRLGCRAEDLPSAVHFLHQQYQTSANAFEPLLEAAKFAKRLSRTLGFLDVHLVERIWSHPDLRLAVLRDIAVSKADLQLQKRRPIDNGSRRL